MDDDEFDRENSYYNGSKEVARFFRARAALVLDDLGLAIEESAIRVIPFQIEPLTPREYLARCMWAASG